MILHAMQNITSTRLEFARGILTAMALLAPVCLAPAQPQRGPAGSAYIELLGNTAVYSVNMDLLFPNRWGLRVGLMLEDAAVLWDEEVRDGGEATDFALVAMGNYFLGRGPSRLELGLGVLLGQDADRRLDAMGIPLPTATATVGYRLQPGWSNLVFRAGFTPILRRGGVVPRAGLSLGLVLF